MVYIDGMVRCSWRGALLAAGLLAASGALAFDRLIAFGDSLSDAGNVYDLSGNIIPSAPYWEGRFSNGPVWVEVLAARLGVASLRSRAGGDVFAYAGTTSGSGSSYGIAPNLANQVAEYLARETPAPQHLVAIWSGANDYFDGQRDESIVVGNLLDRVGQLADAGAVRFMLPNLPLLGETPAMATDPERTALNAVSLRHNELLRQRLAALRVARPALRIYELDVAGIFAAARSDPSAFGLSNVTDPAIDADLGRADEYLFWDPIHPTRVGHRIIAERAYALVPEPATVTGLILGGAILARRRRRFSTGANARVGDIHT